MTAGNGASGIAKGLQGEFIVSAGSSTVAHSYEASLGQHTNHGPSKVTWICMAALSCKMQGPRYDVELLIYMMLQKKKNQDQGRDLRLMLLPDVGVLHLSAVLLISLNCGR